MALKSVKTEASGAVSRSRCITRLEAKTAARKLRRVEAKRAERNAKSGSGDAGE